MRFVGENIEIVNKSKNTLPYSLVVNIYIPIILIWIVIVKMAYPVFQNSRNGQPFAEIISIFPLFYVVIAVYVIISLYILLNYKLNLYSTLTIIITGSLLLWYTPYLLSGFVKQTDTLWHMGMAANMPEIIGGAQMPFTSYVTTFPFSFAFGYTISTITGCDIIILSNYILPLIFIIIFTLFIYLIISSLTNKEISAISTILCIALLHYISLHFSPQVIGFIILLMTIFLLLTNMCKFALLVGFVILPVTHIISFAFFVPMIVIFYLFKKMDGTQSAKSFLTRKNILYFLIFLVAFLILTPLTGITYYVDYFFSQFSISSVFPFIFNNLFLTPWFKVLSTMIYLIMGLIFAIFILNRFLYKFFKGIKIITMISEMGLKSQLMILFPIVCLIIGIALADIKQSPVLIERGLFFFIIFSSVYIIKNNYTRIMSVKGKKILVSSFVILFLAYPLCSYSIDTYNSFPKSEGAGLQHLTNNVNISNKAIDLTVSGQIDAFIYPGLNLTMYPTDEIYDIILYRRSVDYKSMLHNQDSNDQYLEEIQSINSNKSYSKIYHNPTYQIYYENENA